MKIEYSDNNMVAIFNGVKFRKDLKTGYFLSTRKTELGKRERLHCYVWRYYNGEIPDGYHVHHVDGDKNNNDIGNLRCINGKAHVRYHSVKRSIENYEAVRENLIEKAIPKASEWHHSQKGRKWHSDHAKTTIANMQEREYVCQFCEKRFYKKPLGLIKYCSNYCKTKARSKSGIDNERRTCAICGGEFFANKYSKQKCCSAKCGHKLSENTKRRKMQERAGVQHGG